MKKTSLDQAKKISAKRYEKLEELNNDPFIGYSSLEEATNDYQLSSQAEVLARMLKRENVFISGPAGSGKTTIVNRFIELIDAEYDGKFEIAVTASTGISAVLIGGQTIHSWAGLGISTEPFNSKKIDGMMWSKAKHIAATDVLIIDEVSMLPAHLFEKLDLVLQHFRRNKKPFGGVQLVLLGDFLQLPPVRGRNVNSNVNTDYAITTEAWKNADIKHCYMDKTHRATDKKLRYILNKIAVNKVDDTVRQLIKSRMNVTPDPDKVYTTLFTTNMNVDEFNKNKLSENVNPSVFVKMRTDGAKKDIEKIVKSHKIEEMIELKIGATVMLTANIKDPVTGQLYANGTVGKIETFLAGLPRVRFNDGRVITIEKRVYNLEQKKVIKDRVTKKDIVFEEVVASVEQVPLKLGYAITVHKSQGQTFSGVIADLSKCFTPGLGYVALSRVRTLDDLIITGFTDKAYEVDERSRKISNYVKHRALELRKSFIENKTQYESLLTASVARKMYWNAELAKGNKLRENNAF